MTKAAKENKVKKSAVAANGRSVKATKAVKAKAPAKTKAPKIVRNKGETKAAGGIGHNSGEVNKSLVVLFDDYAALDEQAKEIAKAKRDVRAKAKEEHGVLSSVFNHEVKLRKLDRDVRVQFEQGHNDLKGMLGYQLTLDLIAQERKDQEQQESELDEDGEHTSGEGENLNDEDGQDHDEEGEAA